MKTLMLKSETRQGSSAVIMVSNNKCVQINFHYYIYIFSIYIGKCANSMVGSIHTYICDKLSCFYKKNKCICC